MSYITQTVDSAGNPAMVIAHDTSPASTEKVIAVIVKPYATGTAKDVFGQTANTYTPTIIQICTESNSGAVTGAAYVGAFELLPVLAEAIKRGAIIEWHVTPYQTVPSIAAIETGSYLAATYMDLYWTIQKAI
jgi:hypothetical protein